MNLWVPSFQNISELDNCWSWVFGGSKSKSCRWIWVLGIRWKEPWVLGYFKNLTTGFHVLRKTNGFLCLSSKDFRTMLMYQNRVLDLFENHDYLRTTNLKNHLDTQPGGLVWFFKYPLSTGGHPFIDFFFTSVGYDKLCCNNTLLWHSFLHLV